MRRGFISSKCIYIPKNKNRHSAYAEERKGMNAVRVIDLIKTIAEMRDAYPFSYEKAFVNIDTDALSRLPKVGVRFLDDEKDLEVTMQRVVKIRIGGKHDEG